MSQMIDKKMVAIIVVGLIAVVGILYFGLTRELPTVDYLPAPGWSATEEV